jgi:pyruvate dehydrogenase E2 component (dihydrolipoamide acetyltransferase)
LTRLPAAANPLLTNQLDMAIEIKLPALGDDIDSGDVLEVKVHEGEMIQKDQGILEIETDKATVEVPSTHAGKVLKVHIRDGQTVSIGAPLITLEESAGGERSQSGPEEGRGAGKSAAAAPPPAASPDRAQPGPARPDGEAAERADESAVSESGGRSARTTEAPRPAPAARPGSAGEEPGGAIPAGPSVRRFAREVGVDLSGVAGSGPGGRILREDVLSLVRTASEVARGRAAPGQPADKAAEEVLEQDAWGPVRREKLPKIRKTIAAKMAESWSAAPRVTNYDDADVTELDRIRQSSKDDYAADGIKLTSLPFVIKAVAMSLRKHPVINASIDVEQDQVVYKQYVHIGVAVDSPRGLVVPSLRHADKLSIPDIARQLAQLAEKVRGGNYSVDELRGSTFTISNLGAVGGTYSTPMINVPEVAILLLGRARKMPVVVDDKVVVRLVMPLSLSYDHRLVDGAAAARFLNDVRAFLEAPSRLLLAP